MTEVTPLLEVLLDPGAWNLDEPAPWRGLATYQELIDSFVAEIAPLLGLRAEDVRAYILAMPDGHAVYFECEWLWPIMVDTIALAFGLDLDPDRPLFTVTVH